jgi:hypothetical protein
MSIADYVAVAKRIGLGAPTSIADATEELEGPAKNVADRLPSHHLVGLVHRAAHEVGCWWRVLATIPSALAQLVGEGARRSSPCSSATAELSLLPRSGAALRRSPVCCG